MLRFNKVQRDADNKVVAYEPGLHFKVPLTDSIKVLDARIRTFRWLCNTFLLLLRKKIC